MKIKHIFYLFVGTLYAASYYLNATITSKAIQELYIFLKKLTILLILVMVLLIVMEGKKAKKLMEKAIKSKHSPLLFIIAGIASMGSIYLLYPFLQKLKKQGASYAHIAAFLYARAIKIPLIPLLAYYFSLSYALIFTFVLLIFSFIMYYSVKHIERWLNGENMRSNR